MANFYNYLCVSFCFQQVQSLQVLSRQSSGAGRSRGPPVPPGHLTPNEWSRMGGNSSEETMLADFLASQAANNNPTPRGMRACNNIQMRRDLKCLLHK